MTDAVITGTASLDTPFRDWLAMTWTWSRELAIELPKTTAAEFSARLQELPMYAYSDYEEGAALGLRYSNGSLPHAGHRRRDQANMTFFDIPAADTSKFVRSSAIGIFDRFYVDTPVGQQVLTCVGKRFELSRGPNGEPCISLKQIVCATSDNAWIKQLQQHVPGPNTPESAVIWRCYEWAKPHDDEATVLARREVCGVLHFSDIVPSDFYQLNDLASYLMYADVLDWVVERMAEARAKEEVEVASIQRNHHGGWTIAYYGSDEVQPVEDEL